MKSALRGTILSILWRAVRKRVAHDNPYVIAITGSVGKTSTKEAIALILEGTGRPVIKTQGNMATDTGIPISLLGFPDRAKTPGRWIQVLWRALRAEFPTYAERPYYVLELSSDTPGDLAFLARHFPIHCAVLTTGGPVHLELYKTEQAVVDEIATIVPFIQPDGYIVTNADDLLLQTIKSTLPTIRYGMYAKNLDVQGVVLSRGTDVLECSIEWPIHAKALDSMPSRQTKKVTFRAAVWGEYQLYPLIAAAAVAMQEGVAKPVLLKALQAYSLPAGRGRIIPGHRDVTIIDDTANSSPEAVIAGLEMLRPFAGKRRTVAILGTMNELGEFARALHAKVGAAAAGKIDYLIALGQFAPDMQHAAEKAGMVSAQTITFPAPEQLMGHLSQLIQKNDVVYLKASQNGMRLERLVKQLMQYPGQAATLLVRQGNEWKE